MKASLQVTVFAPRLGKSKINIAAAGGRLIGSLGSILAVLGRGTGPRGEEMAGRFTGTDSQDLATILDPFGAIFVELGTDRLSATCTLETSET